MYLNISIVELDFFFFKHKIEALCNEDKNIMCKKGWLILNPKIRLPTIIINKYMHRQYKNISDYSEFHPIRSRLVCSTLRNQLQNIKFGHIFG